MKLKPGTPRFSKISVIWIVTVRAQGETTIHVPRSNFKLHENLEPQSAEAGRPPRAILVIVYYFELLLREKENYKKNNIAVISIHEVRFSIQHFHLKKT